MDIQTEIYDFAKYLHEEYENSARVFGWVTQDVCRVPFNKLPEANMKTMLSLSEKILRKQEALKAENERLKAELDSIAVPLPVDKPKEYGKGEDPKHYYPDCSGVKERADLRDKPKEYCTCENVFHLHTTRECRICGKPIKTEKIEPLAKVDDNSRKYYEQTKPDILRLWDKVQEIIDHINKKGV